MKSNISLDRFIKFFVGMAITGLGITLVYSANLGSTPMSTLSEGVALTLKIIPGTANIYLNVGILFVFLFIDRSKIGIGTLLSTVSFGIFINLWTIILGDSFVFTNYGLRLLICLIGIILEAYGLSYYMRADLGYGALELISNYTSQKFNISFARAKQMQDFTLVVTGVILGGTIGVGTILGVVLMGYFIGLFLKRGKEKNEII